MAKQLGAIIAGVSLLAVIVLAPHFGAGIAFKDDMINNAGKVAAGLFTIALFMERALAMINGLWASKPERRAIADLHAAVLAGADSTEALRRIADLETVKEKIRLAVGFVFGLFLAAAGVRTLQSLLQVDTTPWRGDDLFYVVDIVLTAGLLAGGSNGLAAIIDVLKAQAQTFIIGTRLSLAPERPKAGKL